MQFKQGCKPCGYRYEREPGYFTGASWMVCFPLVALSGLGLGALMLAGLPGLALEWTLLIASLFSLLLGFFSMPYCMALWMYLDHRLHKLE